MNRKHIAYLAGLLLVAGLGYFAVSRYPGARENESSTRVRVAASFYPLYFLASEIGGERVEVTNLTPAGAEPHDYELTPQDIARVEKSRLLVLNGGGLEAWGNDLVRNLQPGGPLVVEAGAGLMTEQMLENGTEVADPHVWLSPGLYARMAENVAAGLEAADPANADFYRQNLAILQERLSGLDQGFRSGLRDCRQKEIIVAHNAFGYLAAAYGLEQVPIAGLSPDAEPSPKQLARVSEFARERGVKYIFFESLVSPELSQTIAREAGAGTLVLNPLEGLREEEERQGKNYLTEMENNLANLRLALECE